MAIRPSPFWFRSWVMNPWPKFRRDLVVADTRHARQQLALISLAVFIALLLPGGGLAQKTVPAG